MTSGDHTAKMPFGQQLRRFRAAAGMTQEALSERSSISVDAISALENGRRLRPHSYTVGALADALRLSQLDRDRLAAAADPGVIAVPAPELPETARPGAPGQGPVRVAIVDDHPITRYGMERVLADAPGLQLVLSAPDTADLLTRLTDDAGPRADVVVMDLYLRDDRPSLDALRQLAALSPVLVISASTRPADVFSAIQAGASGYLTKRAVARTFAAAIEAVYSGGFWLSSELASVLRSELGAGAGDGIPADGAGISAPQAGISAQEDEILSCIASGLSYEQTARRMGISTTAVDRHIQQIRARMGGGDDDPSRRIQEARGSS